MLLDPVAKLLALFDCVQQPSLTALDAVDPSLLETCASLGFQERCHSPDFPPLSSCSLKKNADRS